MPATGRGIVTETEPFQVSALLLAQIRRYRTRENGTPLGYMLHGILGRPAALCTVVAVAYDAELAGRIRQLIGSDPELTEKQMFGGLAFLIRGNMAIAASSGGGAMVRVDPAQSDFLLATTKATLVNMRGRDMPGWLRVRPDDLRADDQLAAWVEIGTGYARSLPPK